MTYYDGVGRAGSERARRSSRCASAARGKPVALGAYGDIRRSVGPVAIERNQLQRAAHVLMQTEGRDIGTAAEELERKLAAATRAPGTWTSASSARSS